jgi:hypothetical protein
LLLRLDSAILPSLFDQVLPDGADIRFSKADGTPLEYQIERWNASGPSAMVWVGLDTVFADRDSQQIVIYWGNPDAESNSKGSKVFDPVFGFNGVWHLDEAAQDTGMTDVYLDASFYRNNGDDYISGNNRTGVIGRGINLDGIADHVKIWDNPAYDLGKGPFSISLWFRKVEEERGDVFNYESYDATDDFGIILQEDETLDVYVLIDNVGSIVVDNDSPFTLNEWHHAAVVRDGDGNITTYVDGEVDGTGFSKANLSHIEKGSYILLGRNHYQDQITQPYEGALDEFRLSSVKRSGDWIKLSYQNQRPDSDWLR